MAWVPGERPGRFRVTEKREDIMETIGTVMAIWIVMVIWAIHAVVQNLRVGELEVRVKKLEEQNDKRRDNKRSQ